ncbi:hypothetical protein GUITHDRAFT_154196 [Guillardia theta CCMP2712]|uniref:Uncharacterized protein n=1 Tax=Guillardia theta (strain CCMP2712) TaxID=905079 RepID=L1IVE7_GUITC|nr:hypothetical protein GUITHDRAFT_154196 [Guillardia theta CCMP2712]EKX40231.1 hypothetical protein GUITHDRAFT_154196 [Guillardia theta CCMP2712]|eukprot:XP_005827211.1 hypothetical protein GUITHDRAFT_154196 [Guillardia theta CCMP2712]
MCQGMSCSLAGIFVALFRSAVMFAWSLLLPLDRHEVLQDTPLNQAVDDHNELVGHEDSSASDSQSSRALTRSASANHAHHAALRMEAGSHLSLRCKLLEHPDSHACSCSCLRCMKRMRSELLSSFEQARLQGYIVVTTREAAGRHQQGRRRRSVL